MSTKSLFQQQGDFFGPMGSPSLKTHSVDFCCNLAEKLITEECVHETLPALRRYQVNPTLENLTELADGLVDTVYVCLHACHSLDIPFDLVWDEVHRSNLAKIQPDGSVKRREDGKILKPKGWAPPNIFEVLKEYQGTRDMGKHYMEKGMVK